jgi:hypothetical protein
MKSPVLRSLMAIGLILAACCAASWRIVTDASDMVVQTYRRAKAWITNAVFHGLALASSQPGGRQMAVLLVRAKCFYARLMRRERPVMTNGWRMCSSI